jgi:phenylacetate-coenzyme A ligase PaaK-like adenylate-forming protein
MHERVRSALRSGLGVNPEVEVLAAGTLPRLEQAKAKRVLDRRASTASGRGAR